MGTVLLISVTFCFSKRSYSVNWGDDWTQIIRIRDIGAVSSTHTYEKTGKYMIKVGLCLSLMECMNVHVTVEETVDVY